MGEGSKRKGAIDSRDRTLGLYSIDDLYKKLLWEIQQFATLATSESSPNLPACYMAQNAAATAWHLGDWLSQELDAIDYWAKTSELTGKALRNKSDLQTWMRSDLGLMACEQIADATKHARLFPWVYRRGFTTENRFYDLMAEVDPGGVITKVHEFQETISPIPKVVLSEGPARGIHEIEPLLMRAATWWNDLLGTIRYSQGPS